MSTTDQFAPFLAKMRDAAQPDIAIETFRHYYDALRRGATGMIAEAEITSATDVPRLEDIGDHSEAGRAALSAAVVIKLNGGLGTSMGMSRAKSLLTVKDGLSFLDIIARQILSLRQAHDCALPLVLMDSFRTRADSLEALAAYPALDVGLPLDFVQHKVPRIDAETLAPAESPDAPERGWCPPGHGDIYPALQTSGMLAALRERGIRYAFVSNADNLGAVMDVNLLGYVASQEVPFLMEVCQRTEADKKGGHLAQRVGGGLVLRESAQCLESDRDAFQDWRRHQFFNTNSLWVDFVALEALMGARGGVLGLPVIINRKTLDPADPTSRPVIQLETAMGAAISVFEGARAVHVPKTRFAPVKTTNDLLGLWSDVYVRTDDERVVISPGRAPELGPLVVSLDPAFYKLTSDLQARFPRGAPSLIACRSFTVGGDVRFGRDVVAVGDVAIAAEPNSALQISDGQRLAGQTGAPQ